MPGNAQKRYAYKLVWVTARREKLPAQYSNCFPRLLKKAKTESEWKQDCRIGILFARTSTGTWKAYAHVSNGQVYDGNLLPMEEDYNA